MRKILLSTTSLVFGAALALSVAGTASAGEIGDSIEQAAKDSKVALDWLEGKAASYGKNNVSYDGPVITLTSTSHVPSVSSLAKLQIKAWNNLERMSKGKIKVKASWSASVHSVREGRKAARTGLTPMGMGMLHVRAVVRFDADPKTTKYEPRQNRQCATHAVVQCDSEREARKAARRWGRKGVRMILSRRWNRNGNLTRWDVRLGLLC